MITRQLIGDLRCTLALCEGLLSWKVSDDLKIWGTYKPSSIPWVIVETIVSIKAAFHEDNQSWLKKSATKVGY